MSRVAVLIDGGCFMRRLPSVLPEINPSDPEVSYVDFLGEAA